MDATENKPTGIPPDILAEMNQAIANAMRGIRDREAMRRACESMDRISQEIYQKHGILDIGVPAIRELRDGE